LICIWNHGIFILNSRLYFGHCFCHHVCCGISNGNRLHKLAGFASKVFVEMGGTCRGILPPPAYLTLIFRISKLSRQNQTQPWYALTCCHKSPLLVHTSWLILFYLEYLSWKHEQILCSQTDIQFFNRILGIFFWINTEFRINRIWYLVNFASEFNLK